MLLQNAQVYPHELRRAILICFSSQLGNGTLENQLRKALVTLLKKLKSTRPVNETRLKAKANSVCVCVRHVDISREHFFENMGSVNDSVGANC